MNAIGITQREALGGFDRSSEPIGQMPPAPSARAVEMAETMREILFRDGNVTETALAGEGYSPTEIVEHAEEARRLAGLTLAVAGRHETDRLQDVIAKALHAGIFAMPITGGVTDAAPLRVRWSLYCTAVAAHRLDPWVSQSERCLVRLKSFLDGLPLLEREKNRVVTEVAASLKRRVLA